jgi:hypothetical protein
MRLVDSDVIIWNWRGREAAAELLGAEPFAISAVTYMELVQGMRNARELRDLQSDLKLCSVSPRITVRIVNSNAAPIPNCTTPRYNARRMRLSFEIEADLLSLARIALLHRRPVISCSQTAGAAGLASKSGYR